MIIQILYVLNLSFYFFYAIINLWFLKSILFAALKHDVDVCCREFEDLVRVTGESKMDSHLFHRRELILKVGKLCLVANFSIYCWF